MADNYEIKVTDFYDNSCQMLSNGTSMCGNNSNAPLPKKSNSKKKLSNRVSTTQNNVTKYSYVFDKGRTDKRVSLNVSPLIHSSSSHNTFADRVTYVLGKERLKSKYVYGFLYGCLNKSCGLIFPYTPTLTFTHSVNYETTDIIHSNLHTLSYKNTPPPSISLNATFTADTRDNALHMLSAIWFLRAVTKCDFGEHSSDNNQPGMPPPILYLNGYNQIMDNIPVVVENFSYTLPEDKDYVALGINLNSNSNKFIYNVQNENPQQSGDIMLNGIKTALQNITGDTTTILSNGNPNNEYYFNNWLPTELKFSIQLKVNPNLLKYKKQFDLNLYKMGIYNLKNPEGELVIPSSNGNINLICEDKNAIINFLNQQYTAEKEELINEYNIKREKIMSGQIINQGYMGTLIPNNQIKNDIAKAENELNDTILNLKSKYENKMSNIKNNINNDLSDAIQIKKYQFDNSGWTW